jgi:hypothetical protein
MARELATRGVVMHCKKCAMYLVTFFFYTRETRAGISNHGRVEHLSHLWAYINTKKLVKYMYL